MPRQVKVADDCSTHLYLFQVKIKYLFGGKYKRKKMKKKILGWCIVARNFEMWKPLVDELACAFVYPSVRAFVHATQICFRSFSFFVRALAFLSKSNKLSHFFLSSLLSRWWAPHHFWYIVICNFRCVLVLHVLFVAVASQYVLFVWASVCRHCMQSENLWWQMWK